MPLKEIKKNTNKYKKSKLSNNDLFLMKAIVDFFRDNFWHGQVNLLHFVTKFLCEFVWNYFLM